MWTVSASQYLLLLGVSKPGLFALLQEHFYLEPNASIVIPGENDEYLSYSSTQVGARGASWRRSVSPAR